MAYAALAAASVLLTWFYVGAERCVYYWDFVNFQNRAFFLAELACARPLSAAAAVIRSLHHDYTYLPCVPLVPVLLAFGRSRMVFELALALVYLAPFCLVCAALTARITRRRGDALSWPAAAIALLTPAACVPVFRGYPDLGGAALVGMAFLLLFRDPALRRQRSRYAIAALLALAALFRRHYAYSAAALAAVVLMGILAAAVSGLRTGRHAAIARALRRGQALAHLCLALAVFSSPLLVTALAGGYSRLYRSYQESAWATLGFFGSAFGWLPLALGAAGLLWTARRRGISGHHARLLALFGCAFLAFWALGGRFTGVHYATHLAAPAIVGLAVLIERAWRTRRTGVRVLSTAALGVVVAANALAGMTSLDTGRPPLRALLAAANPPLVRTDLPELGRLVAYLRGSAAGEPVYVAASSAVLNESILREAERQFRGRRDTLLQVLPTSDVDSRDPSPPPALAAARWVVVAEPFQHVLRPEEQDVVRDVVDSFANGRGVAAGFERVPVEFTLDRGVKVTVFHRVRPSRGTPEGGRNGMME